MDNVSFIVNEVIGTIQDYLKSVFGNVETPFSKLQGKTKWLVNQQLFLEKTWQFINRIQDIINVASPLSSEVEVKTSGNSTFQNEGCQTENFGISWDTSMVQLTSSKEEIERRINTFIKRKRMELDIYNQREFTVIAEDPSASTCARTDAVDVPRQGKKSLVKVSTVEDSGVSREHAAISARESTTSAARRHCWEASHPSQALNILDAQPSVQERLDNIAAHLEDTNADIMEESTDLSNSQSVMHRIKNLENKILFLEGLSPEYFRRKQKGQLPKMKKGAINTLPDLPSAGHGEVEYGSAPSDLDRRIAKLRSILLQRGNGSSN